MGYDTAVLIGAGGMGEVFKAWDSELERWVALKYLRHDDPHLVERLLREARAQARVDHPAVAKVYEVGEDEGRPYIAMQYVDGRQLDVVAADLSLEQKVLLVQQVADAVQAAHAVGLIHRDLKPGNILVTESGDGELRPFVLDFGIARVCEVAGLTTTGQVLGTPGYLAPEQARGADVDRRCDLFSLGVILFELLCGAAPFAGDSSLEVLIQVLESEAPPVRRLAPHVHRDLETVVMRCLEKEPEKRYDSARALADDLGRYLAGEPVLARPITRVERLLRVARKHRVTTALAVVSSLVVLALVGALGASWVKYTADLKRERNLAVAARAAAEEREKEARETADFLTNLFQQSAPDRARGHETTVREVLDIGAAKIRSGFADRPAARAHFMGLIGYIYWKLGQYGEAEELLEDAVRLAEEHYSDERLAEVGTMTALGILHATLGRYDDAEPLFVRMVEVREKVLGPEHLKVAQALNNLGNLYYMQGKYAAAEPPYRRALEIKEKVGGADNPDVAQGLMNLANLNRSLGRYEEADALHRRSLEIRRRVQPANHPDLALGLASHAEVLRDLGDDQAAEQELRQCLTIREEVLGSDHSDVGLTLESLAGTLASQGRYGEADPMFERARRVLEAGVGPDHPYVARVHHGLGDRYRGEGRWEEAEASYREALAILESSLESDHPDIAVVLDPLGAVLLEQGRLDEAEEVLARALAIRRAKLAPDHPDREASEAAYAEVLAALGTG